MMLGQQIGKQATKRREIRAQHRDRKKDPRGTAQRAKITEIGTDISTFQSKEKRNMRDRRATEGRHGRCAKCGYIGNRERYPHLPTCIGNPDWRGGPINSKQS